MAVKEQKNAQKHNAQSAKPGAEAPAAAKKPKKEKVPRTPWGQRDAEGKLTTPIQGKAAPAGFDPKKNSPLRRSDFAAPADFLDYRADRAEEQAKRLRQDAIDERSGTGKLTKGKQKRLKSLKDKYEELRKELEEAGVDVDAALASKE